MESSRAPDVPPVPAGQHPAAGPVPVASDQGLVAEAVAAALVAHGLVARAVPWRDPGDPPTEVLVPDAVVGVLLCDFDRPDRLNAARHLVIDADHEWIVLTGAPVGPLWGAMLAAGACTVLPSSTDLGSVVTTVRRAAAGEEVMDRRLARRSLAAWRTAMDAQHDLASRMRTLSPRESAVLGMLYAGGQVRDIALELGVAEATVRTQVWSVLRKLGVSTQLAAVAAYAEVRQGAVHPAADAVVREAEKRIEGVSPNQGKTAAQARWRSGRAEPLTSAPV